MKTGLQQLFKTTSVITEIVEDRTYINKLPQTADRTLDHIIITQMSSNEHNSLDGTSELRFIDFDIDCKATTPSRADTLAKVVRAFLKDYTGSAGDETIDAVIYTDESDGFEPFLDGSDEGLDIVTLDFNIQYRPV